MAGATDAYSTFVTSSPGLIAADTALFRSISWNWPSRSNVIFSFTDSTRSICDGRGTRDITARATVCMRTAWEVNESIHA